MNGQREKDGLSYVTVSFVLIALMLQELLVLDYLSANWCLLSKVQLARFYSVAVEMADIAKLVGYLCMAH